MASLSKLCVSWFIGIRWHLNALQRQALNGMSAYGINECFIRQIASFAFILNMPDVCIDGFLDFVLKHDDSPCQADDGDDHSKSQP